MADRRSKAERIRFLHKLRDGSIAVAARSNEAKLGRYPGRVEAVHETGERIGADGG